MYLRLVFFIPLIFSLPLLSTSLSNLTLEEKVGQVFMVYFNGEEFNSEAEHLLHEVHVGGIIYYNWANGLHNPTQVKTLSSSLQKNSRIPLFIATDQEGGAVARLQKGFTEFPGNAALGETKNPELAYHASLAMGKEMLAVGVNMTLAPVVDVNNNPQNPIIGIRSFGDTPEIVSNFAKKSVEGFLNAGVIPCLKHFPGHGDVNIDSHIALPIVEKDIKNLINIELKPFRDLAHLTPAIMTAHILFPKLDSEHCATLSSTILNSLLRKNLKFEGLLITDSLTMKGVNQEGKPQEQIFIDAFLAGNDILLVGGRDLNIQIEGESNVDQISRFYQALLSAVRSGIISEERLNESVKRILSLKRKMNFHKKIPLTDLEKKDHQKIAKSIAKHSVQLRSGAPPQNLDQKNILLVSPKALIEKVKASRLSLLGKTATFFSYDSFDIKEWEIFQNHLRKCDYVILITANAWKNTQSIQLLQNTAKGRPTLFIAARDPIDLELIKDTEASLATFSPTVVSLDEAARILETQETLLR